ncbi:hypothetical protein INR49_001781, partial [Caranx melampygus]
MRHQHQVCCGDHSRARGEMSVTGNRHFLLKDKLGHLRHHPLNCGQIAGMEDEDKVKEGGGKQRKDEKCHCRVKERDRERGKDGELITTQLSSSRISRAASVLLSDPCFQLHSIQHLLGEGGETSSSSAAATSTARPVVGSLGSSVAQPIPSAAGNAGSTERKHFSLHAYTDYISEEEKQKVELMLAFLTEESKQAAASTA